MSPHPLAASFARLHDSGCFLIGNAWDAGSARLLARLGFPAIATSSAGFAGTCGLDDGGPTRDAVIAHVRAVVAATGLPVSADLENGFGDAPEAAALAVALAAAAGAAGGSIEDAPRESGAAVYDLGLSVERVHAAAERTRAIEGGFVLTARCENFLRGRPDLDDTIARLQAYERAGAQVLFAPGLRSLAQVREVCAAVSRPVNFMVGVPGHSFTLAELAAAGVRRVSFAHSFYVAAMRAAEAAAREAIEHGTFGYLNGP